MIKDKFQIKTNGVTRLVFLIGRYAIKIPNFTYSHLHFLNGCYSNWSERHVTKLKIEEFQVKTAPTLFCSWFGLLSVQIRAEPRIADLTEAEKDYFKNQTTDIKPQNFGYIKGRLVCVDYA